MEWLYVFLYVFVTLNDSLQMIVHHAIEVDRQYVIFSNYISNQTNQYLLDTEFKMVILVPKLLTNHFPDMIIFFRETIQFFQETGLQIALRFQSDSFEKQNFLNFLYQKLSLKNGKHELLQLEKIKKARISFSFQKMGKNFLVIVTF